MPGLRRELPVRAGRGRRKEGVGAHASRHLGYTLDGTRAWRNWYDGVLQQQCNACFLRFLSLESSHDFLYHFDHKVKLPSKQSVQTRGCPSSRGANTTGGRTAPWGRTWRGTGPSTTCSWESTRPLWPSSTTSSCPWSGKVNMHKSNNSWKKLKKFCPLYSNNQILW